MYKAIQHIKGIMDKNGYRLTVQKKTILEEMYKAGIHLTAKEIHERVKNKNIGLATIYRAMRIFSDLNIVKEIYAEGTSYYEAKIYSQKPLHIHFQCVQCNSIIDIDDIDIDYKYIKINRLIEEEKDIEIFDANIMLMGLCDKCREEKKCLDQ